MIDIFFGTVITIYLLKVCNGVTNNIQEFISMTQYSGSKHGIIMNLQEFTDFFSA